MEYCLNDYIGIQGCANATSDSGEYLNRLLPGITLENIDKIAEADQVTYLGVWTDVQKRSWKRFQNELIRGFQNRYQIQSIQKSVDLLKFIDTSADQTLAAAEWRGFTVELTPLNTQIWAASDLQMVYVQSLRIYRKAVTVAAIGKIFDLVTGEVLHTFTIPVNTVAGWTTISIEQYFLAYRLFMAYDATAIESVSQVLNADTINHFHDCGCDFYYNGFNGGIRGAKTASLLATVTDDDITTGSNIYGLSGVFSIQCSFNALVCNNKESFLMPWAYILGAELMWERQYSGRISRWTVGIDKEKAKELQREFESRFFKEIETVIAGISLNDSDVCLECNAPIQYVESTM